MAKIELENESLKAAEAECATGRTAPRVTLDMIKARIENVVFVMGSDLIDTARESVYPNVPDNLEPSEKMDRQQVVYNGAMKRGEVLTICLMTLHNGFMVLGKSAPASPANYDADLGRKLAYEDCIRQLWPLCAFSLLDFQTAEAAEAE